MIRDFHGDSREPLQNTQVPFRREVRLLVPEMHLEGLASHRRKWVGLILNRIHSRAPEEGPTWGSPLQGQVVSHLTGLAPSAHGREHGLKGESVSSGAQLSSFESWCSYCTLG